MQSAGNLPFRFQEVKQLAQLGLNPENFKFGNMTFESQKYICVKEGQVSQFVNKFFVRAGSLKEGRVNTNLNPPLTSLLIVASRYCGHLSEFQGRSQRHEGWRHPDAQRAEHHCCQSLNWRERCHSGKPLSSHWTRINSNKFRFTTSLHQRKLRMLRSKRSVSSGVGSLQARSQSLVQALYITLTPPMRLLNQSRSLIASHRCQNARSCLTMSTLARHGATW